MALRDYLLVKHGPRGINIVAQLSIPPRAIQLEPLIIKNKRLGPGFELNTCYRLGMNIPPPAIHQNLKVLFPVLAGGKD